MSTRILVAGIPRGGTTWIGAALAAAPGATYVHEPDNWASDALAFLSQREVGRFPVLAVEDQAPVYDLVWRLAMRGGWPARGAVATGRELACRLPRRLAPPALLTVARIGARRAPLAETVVTKTVQGLGSLEWLAGRHADAVVVIRADSRSVASSWRTLGWGSGYIDASWFGRHRPDLLERAGGWPDDEIGQVAVAIGALQTLRDEACARHPDWVVISHEDLCREPLDGFRQLFDRLGLVFDSGVEDYITRSDVPGEGLDTRRRTAEQPDRWRRLPAGELARVEAILSRFSL